MHLGSVRLCRSHLAGLRNVFDVSGEAGTLETTSVSVAGPGLDGGRVVSVAGTGRVSLRDTDARMHVQPPGLLCHHEPASDDPAVFVACSSGTGSSAVDAHDPAAVCVGDHTGALQRVPHACGGTASAAGELTGRVQLQRCSMHGGHALWLSLVDGGTVSATWCDVETKHALLNVSGRGRVFMAQCRCGCRCENEKSIQPACRVTGSAAELRMRDTTAVSTNTTFHIQNSGRFRAENCRLVSAGQRDGVLTAHVTSSAAATMVDCTICARAVAVAADSAKVTAVNCDVSHMLWHFFGALQSIGSHLGGPSANVRKHVLKCGYHASDCTLVVLGGTVRGCHTAIHVSAQDPECITVTEDVRFSDCGIGVLAKAVELTVQRCAFVRENCFDLSMWPQETQAGVILDGSVKAVVEKCEFAACPVGIQAAGTSYVFVMVRGCRFKDAQHGVVFNKGGRMEDCSFLRVQECVAVCMGPACVSGSKFLQSDVGISVGCGATLAATDSQFVKCKEGVVVREGAHACMNGCVVRQCDAGIRARTLQCKIKADTLEFVKCKVGVELSAPPGEGTAVLVLSNCEYSACVVAVKLAGVAVNACIFDSRIAEGAVSAVIEDPAYVKLRGVRVSRCGFGFHIGATNASMKHACAVCGRSGRAAFEAAKNAMAGAARAAKGPAPAATHDRGRCIHEGAVTQVVMIDCDVADCAEEGVRIRPHARVTGERVRVSGCKVGIRQDVIGACGAFWDCVVTLRDGTSGGKLAGAVAYLCKPDGDILFQKPLRIPGIEVKHEQS